MGITFSFIIMLVLKWQGTLHCRPPLREFSFFCRRDDSLDACVADSESTAWVGSSLMIFDIIIFYYFFPKRNSSRTAAPRLLGICCLGNWIVCKTSEFTSEFRCFNWARCGVRAFKMCQRVCLVRTNFALAHKWLTGCLCLLQPWCCLICLKCQWKRRHTHTHERTHSLIYLFIWLSRLRLSLMQMICHGWCGGWRVRAQYNLFIRRWWWRLTSMDGTTMCQTSTVNNQHHRKIVYTRNSQVKQTSLHGHTHTTISRIIATYAFIYLFVFTSNNLKLLQYFRNS